ncbi:MAG: polysaccharide pyruvyl transferase CsaB [Armatimonadota bacterium]|nr:polysaccharide pyruvyl transferase CsaB [Armatimonadota bacterium]MDR7439747.1 polysaccharide pyruvyl transferase CsaB [Armatimonadota bacterium]MDR7563082.1 polysaccharide pyruvyl transferase CsaB [Armatimonadota bacterium]MDR7566940.1 polysaccharide pyruvyl transferase CsaB [Armatimonadota bacterium]MDR7601002.1 polysaccharide pyruvyl transferase CsaB [Armatimonadota bacterium]
MRAVVLGYYGFGNMGDEAVLWAMRQHLGEVLPGLQLCVLSADPEATAALHGTESILRTDGRRVRRAMRESAVVLSGGGSLFQDATSWRSPLYYAWLHELARRERRPLVVYAQGLGPLRRGLSRWATRRAMGHAACLTVRDAPSARLLRQLGVRGPIEVVCDPVLGLPAPDPVEGSPWIGVSLRPWPGVSLDPIVEAIAKLRGKAGIPVRVVCFHERVDRGLNEVLARRVGAEGLVVVHAPREAWRAFCGAGLVVAMRFHALLFAALAGAVPVGIAYDPKVQALVDQLPGVEVVSLEELSRGGLGVAVERAWRDRETRVEQLRRSVPSLSARARVPARLVAALVDRVLF